MPYRFLLIYLDVAILVISYENPVNKQQATPKFTFHVVINLTTFEKLSIFGTHEKKFYLVVPKKH